MSNLRFFFLQPVVMLVVYVLISLIFYFAFNKNCVQSMVDAASLVGCMYVYHFVSQNSERHSAKP